MGKVGEESDVKEGGNEWLARAGAEEKTAVGVGLGKSELRRLRAHHPCDKKGGRRSAQITLPRARPNTVSLDGIRGLCRLPTNHDARPWLVCIDAFIPAALNFAKPRGVGVGVGGEGNQARNNYRGFG